MKSIQEKRFIRLTPVRSAHYRTPAEIKKEKIFRKKIMRELDRKKR